YGVGGAQGTNFHPDERQIMYQVIKLSRPSSWAQFMDQAHSPQSTFLCLRHLPALPSRQRRESPLAYFAHPG
ncbi:MAG TPA: hypothetical protein VH164_15840, partial [Ktedonobacteraceae bacterium]|nr:hypothetical protein [Ktedonobacteraceae bacterium]